MPSFPNDRLQPALSHGDLMVQICATDEASCVHALRYLMAGTRGDARRPLAHPRLPAAARRLDRRRRDAGDAAQPARVQGRDGQPESDRRRPHGRARLGQREPGRARLDGRWQLHGRPAHPDVRRALGPDRPRRAGGDHRPDQADRRAAGHRPRGGRARLRERPGRARGSRSTRTSGWRTRGPRDAAEPDPPPRLLVQPRLRRRRPARRGAACSSASSRTSSAAS